MEFCADMADDGATCAWVFKDEPRDIPKPEWDEYRFGQLCTPAKNVIDLQGAIAKLCSKQKCTKEDQEQIKAFFLKIEMLSPK